MNANTFTSLPSPQDLEKAKFRGATAGTLLLAPGLNPYGDDQRAEAIIWDREHHTASGVRLLALARIR